MPLALHFLLCPPLPWWDFSPTLHPGTEIELPLPAAAYPLKVGLLLLNPDQRPAALVALDEYKTAADGSVGRGRVLRVYDEVEGDALADLLRVEDPPGLGAGYSRPGGAP